jgi:two-component system sensor histidine kinase VicK
MSVEDALNKVMADFEEESHEKHVNLHIKEGPAGTQVSVDPTALEVVLSNLVSNGVKFTREGGSVTLRWDEDCEAVYIYVEDTGIGIAAEHMDLIFHRFFKVDPFTSGTGLGLSLVREFLTQMGGSVDIQSELGKGTRVTVTFKKSEQHEANNG